MTPIAHNQWSLLDLENDAPQHTDPNGLATWVLRSDSFVVALTPINRPVTVIREHNPDEYMLVVPPGLCAEVTAGAEMASSDGDGLFIVPRGHSEVRFSGQGLLTRVFSSQCLDFLALAVNAAQYVASGVAPPPQPPQVSAGRLQHYQLADHIDGANGISRVFRSDRLMLNVMVPYAGPRDPRKLFPHAHDDHEQITVCAAGRFVHHLRRPWAPDSTEWQTDRHLEVGSPSALLIPAQIIHTTQAMEAGCRIIDVFGPPRTDFSQIPGMVRNAQHYPVGG
jgi:hypothetical protein